MTVPLRILDHRPLRGGLDSVALEMPVGEGEWKQGVFVQPPARDVVLVWNASCNPVGYEPNANQLSDPPSWLEEKLEGGIPDGFEFAPTFIVAQATCNVGGTVTSIGDLVQQAAVQSLEREKWRTLAAVLHGAAPVFTSDNLGGVPNPSLTGAGGAAQPTQPTYPNPPSPVSLKAAMEALLRSICACTKGDLTFHVPVAFLPYFLVDGFVKFDEAANKYKFGSHEVSFDCYPNEGNYAVEQSNPTATDGSEVWIWATGPIYAAFGTDITVRGLDRRQNKASFLAEVPAIVVYDPTCVYAVKATVP